MSFQKYCGVCATVAQIGFCQTAVHHAVALRMAATRAARDLDFDRCNQVREKVESSNGKGKIARRLGYSCISRKYSAMVLAG
jgi:hypothetical protein